MSRVDTNLKSYMSATQRSQIGNQPTTHRNCIDACGVARPGKTKRDLSRSGGKK